MPLAITIAAAESSAERTFNMMQMLLDQFCSNMLDSTVSESTIVRCNYEYVNRALTGDNSQLKKMLGADMEENVKVRM